MAGTSSVAVYDPAGRPVAMTDARGGITSYAYGPFGARARVTTPDGLVTVTREPARAPPRPTSAPS